MDSDREGSSAAPESSKWKSRPQSTEMREEDTHYTVTFDDEGEGSSDPSARVTLLNHVLESLYQSLPLRKNSFPVFRSLRHHGWMQSLDLHTHSWIFEMRMLFYPDDVTRLSEGSSQYKEFVRLEIRRSAVSVTNLYRDFYFPQMTAEAAERVCIVLANSDGLLPLVKTFRLGLCLRHCSRKLNSLRLTW